MCSPLYSLFVLMLAKVIEQSICLTISIEMIFLYQQNVYFHTSINSIGVMAIVEVISITMDLNGNTKYHPCGWTIVRIFKTDEELPDSSRSSTVPVQK